MMLLSQPSIVGLISICSPWVQSLLLLSYQHVSVGRTHAFALGAQEQGVHAVTFGFARNVSAIVAGAHDGGGALKPSIAARTGVHPAGAAATHSKPGWHSLSAQSVRPSRSLSFPSRQSSGDPIEPPAPELDELPEVLEEPLEEVEVELDEELDAELWLEEVSEPPAPWRSKSLPCTLSPQEAGSAAIRAARGMSAATAVEGARLCEARFIGTFYLGSISCVHEGVA